MEVSCRIYQNDNLVSNKIDNFWKRFIFPWLLDPDNMSIQNLLTWKWYVTDQQNNVLSTINIGDLFSVVKWKKNDTCEDQQ